MKTFISKMQKKFRKIDVQDIEVALRTEGLEGVHEFKELFLK